MWWRRIWWRVARHACIHRTATIGTQPFSFDRANQLRPERKQAKAGVSIGQRVEIFAHANIDQGTERDTTLGDDCKIDHYAHIGHDSILGRGVIVCACACICGYVELGDGVYIGAGAVIQPRLKVGAGARIGSMANVTRDVPAGEVWVGNPARRMVKRKP